MTQYKFNLSGIYTALVTPFSSDSSRVDFESLQRLIDFQIEAGVQGVVVCGSTGEAATLTDDEYIAVVRCVRERTEGKLPCVAGISVSATARGVELARTIEELGCDGVLVATPPYNKPSQAGLLEHFRALHRATSLPIIAYNIPGRSGVAITPSTLGALSREGLVVGIKESSGSVDALADTMIAIKPECQVVSGDDSLTLAALAYGGVGAISASANVLPHESVALWHAWVAGKPAEAKRIQLEMLPKIRALFVESNPVPVKTALALQGIISSPTTRLPLVALAPSSLERVRSEFGI